MRIPLGLMLVALALAGCGSEDESTPATVPDEVGGQIVFEVEERSDSNVAGIQATLEEAGENRTRVSVLGLDQGDPGYQSDQNVLHLHEGTCDEPGRAIELEPSVEGTSTTVVDVDLGVMLTSRYAIEIHLPPADPQGGSDELDPLACGDVPTATS